jgi:hypothetical protein
MFLPIVLDQQQKVYAEQQIVKDGCDTKLDHKALQ